MNDNRIFTSIYGAIVHNHAINRAISRAFHSTCFKGYLRNKEMDNLKIVL